MEQTLWVSINVGNVELKYNEQYKLKFGSEIIPSQRLLIDSLKECHYV